MRGRNRPAMKPGNGGLRHEICKETLRVTIMDLCMRACIWCFAGWLRWFVLYVRS